MDVKVDTNNDEIFDRIKESGFRAPDSESTEESTDFDEIKPNFQLKAVGQLFPSLRIVRGNYISSRLPQDSFQLCLHPFKTDLSFLKMFKVDYYLQN